MKKGYAIQPMVLTNVSVSAAIIKEEICGPLLPVLTYSSNEEAIEVIRNLDKPLGFHVSNDAEFTNYIIRNTTAGGTTVIDVIMPHAFDPAIPMGSVNNSGVGRGYGKYGFLELTNARAVAYQPQEVSTDTFFKPPYE